MTQRRVYQDGGATPELVETYSRPETSAGGNAGFVEVQRLSGGAVLARERHYYQGSARATFFKESYEYPRWKDGKELKTEVYDKGASGALLRTTDNTWEQRPQGGWWGADSAVASAPPVDTRLRQVQTTLNDISPAQVSKQVISYDQYNNQVDVDEYDFGANGPGARKRRTHTDYLMTNLGVNYTTVNPDLINPDAAQTVHLRSLPRTVLVYDGSDLAAGHEKAKTEYEYDTYTAGLTPRPDISGHASRDPCRLSRPPT